VSAQRDSGAGEVRFRLGRIACAIGLHKTVPGSLRTGEDYHYTSRGAFAGTVPWWEYDCARCGDHVRGEDWGSR
jgi:hypothetical protein